MSSCDCYKTHYKTCVCAQNEMRSLGAFFIVVVMIIGFFLIRGCVSTDETIPVQKVQEVRTQEASNAIHQPHRFTRVNLGRRNWIDHGRSYQVVNVAKRQTFRAPLRNS